MASIEKRPLKKGICYCVVFYRNGKKQKISFDSKYRLSDVKTAKLAIEQFLDAEKLGEPIPRAASNFFENAPRDVLKRLTALGFSSAKKEATIEEVWKEYEAYKSTVVKPSTMTNIGAAIRNFVKIVGGGVRLSDLTENDATSFRRKMEKLYAQASIASFVASLRAFATWAIKEGYAQTNVFLSVEKGTMVNESRDFHVPKDWGERIFDACPTQNWRTLFALWRFAGLRQQEPLFLKPSFVDFREKRLTVFAPKTEHCRDGGKRIVPLSPILARELKAQMESLPQGESFLIFTNRRKAFASGFGKILFSAGLEPWPKLFQNMRSSFENDLVAEGYPAHVVATWLGHSPAVQAEHYLRVTDDYFKRAVGDR